MGMSPAIGGPSVEERMTELLSARCQANNRRDSIRDYLKKDGLKDDVDRVDENERRILKCHRENQHITKNQDY